MGRDFTDRSRKALAADLLPGEQIAACVLGEPEGSTLQLMGTGKKIGLAAYDAKKIRDASDPDTMAAVVSRKRHIITRTNQRVLFHQAGVTAKPGKLSLAFPLPEVQVNSAKVKRKTYVIIGFPDNSVQTFTCQHNQPVENMGPAVDLD